MSPNLQPKAPGQLQDKLVELCDSKPLRDVSVSDLCRAAHLSRKTFYVYFDSVDAVAVACFRDVFEPVAESVTDNLLQGPRAGQAVERWLEGVAARSERLLQLHDAFGSDVMRQAALPPISGVVERLLAAQEVPEGLVREYASTAIAGVTLGIAETWVRRRFAEDPAAIAATVGMLLNPGSETLFRWFREAK